MSRTTTGCAGERVAPAGSEPPERIAHARRSCLPQSRCSRPDSPCRARWPSPRFDTDAIVAAAGPAPWRGDGLVHARLRADDGTLVEEEWLDRGTGRTRRQRLGTGGYTTVSDGPRIWSWSGVGRSLSLAEVLDERDPWRRPSSFLLEVWRGLLAGRGEIVGWGELSGTPTWLVEVEPGSEAPPGFRAGAGSSSARSSSAAPRTASPAPSGS